MSDGEWLTLIEAAGLMGISPRALRTRVQNGQIPSEKREGRWMILRDSLRLSPAQIARMEARREDLRQVALEAIDQAHGPARERSYSIIDLKAFQLALAKWALLKAHSDESSPEFLAYNRMMESLAVGCHRFEPGEKETAYREARDQMAIVVSHLARRGGPEAN